MFEGQEIDVDAGHQDVAHLELDHPEDILRQLPLEFRDMTGVR